MKISLTEFCRQHRLPQELIQRTTASQSDDWEKVLRDVLYRVRNLRRAEAAKRRAMDPAAPREIDLTQGCMVLDLDEGENIGPVDL